MDNKYYYDYEQKRYKKKKKKGNVLNIFSVILCIFMVFSYSVVGLWFFDNYFHKGNEQDRVTLSMNDNTDVADNIAKENNVQATTSQRNMDTYNASSNNGPKDTGVISKKNSENSKEETETEETEIEETEETSQSIEGEFVIQASEQMKKRPMKPLFDVLSGMGAKITYLEKEGFLPIKIQGIGGRDNGDQMCTVQLDISKSTQFLSALMLASPMVSQGLKIEITSEKKDGSYIRITRKMMEQQGAGVEFDGNNYIMQKGISYKSGEYQVEPDVSAACYFYAAAALTGGRAFVKNVTWDCMQGDLKFIKLLEKLGCTVSEIKTKDGQKGIEVIGACGGHIKGITVDMNDFSDQTMTLAAIAPFADDVIKIENIGHIRLQESDRIHAVVTELTRAGVKCEEQESAITIYPSIPKPAVIQTYDDHRMAMAFSLLKCLTSLQIYKYSKKIGCAKHFAFASDFFMLYLYALTFYLNRFDFSPRYRHIFQDVHLFLTFDFLNH